MSTDATFRRTSLAAILVIVVTLTACGEDPSPVPSTGATPTSGPSAEVSPPSPTIAPTSTPPQPIAFPLAVVTGITNLKSAITLEELAALAASGQLMVPCGVEVTQPALAPPENCRPANRIATWLERRQRGVALLPPALVEPATRVLRIAGDGSFGLFGPDLFGDPEARAMVYPITGSALPEGGDFTAAWAEYEASEIWTMTNLGSLCSDRGAAYEAVTNGRGWDWVFGGGTARYTAPAVVDPPNPPPYVYAPVPAVDTGNDGATAAIVERSDVAIADHECPVVPDASWVPQLTSTNVFSVPEVNLSFWRDSLGLDMVYLAANHMSDKGVDGIRSTLRLIDEYGIPRTGLGMDLDEALEPAYVEVAGLRIGFVAFNDVPGVAAADAGTPGVAWITEGNVNEAVRRARDGGADLVVCNPQWWGGAEYHDELWPVQETQLGWFDAAGCDHVIGSGTHVAGPLLLRGQAADPSVTLVSPGNYLFGQEWWQEAQEGVILDLTFRGTTLVNVRMHPTVQIAQARPALFDPEGDGRYVMERIWKYATLDMTR